VIGGSRRLNQPHTHALLPQAQKGSLRARLRRAAVVLGRGIVQPLSRPLNPHARSVLHSPSLYRLILSFPFRPASPTPHFLSCHGRPHARPFLLS
jgi:hypothetical protein